MSTSTLSATRALARREFLRSIRSPAMTIQSVVFPAVLLMVLLAVFGTAVGDLDRQPYVQRIGPALIISGAAFGSLAAAVGLFVDRTTGMFSRLRTMPLSGRLGAASPVLARSISEHLRVAGVAVVIDRKSVV